MTCYIADDQVFVRFFIYLFAVYFFVHVHAHNHVIPNAALALAHFPLHYIDSTRCLVPTKSSKGSRSEPSISSRKSAPEIGDGWTTAEVKRKGGKTAGTKDRYWWSPGRKKFRSKANWQK